MPDLHVPSPGNLNATWCATLVDEWVRAGVTDVVVSPGSRSTPMALAVTDRPELAVHVHHDERAAGFLALGLGLGSGRPAVVLTTSGTAAVELHPAVVEAHQASVPMIVVTADRPPELHHVGAAQTVDQNRLFGSSVRWFADPGPPSAETAGAWRSLGSRAVVEATTAAVGPGPVHLNLPFREPLLGAPGPLPAGRADGRPWHTAVVTPSTIDPADLAWLVDAPSRRSVLVAGAGCGPAGPILALAEAAGWPVLADPRSGLRSGHPSVVTTADAILRSPAHAGALRPDLVVRMGEPPASKVLAQWLASSGALQVAVEATGRWFDSDRTAARVVRAVPADLAAALTGVVAPATDRKWADGWRVLEQLATAAVADLLADRGTRELTDPGVAHAVVRALAGRTPAATLVVSSSMPVRDVEWYGGSTGPVRVLANRGANGIDGVVSTAVGVALAAGPDAATVVVVGDVAYLHDSNALLGLAGRGVDLTVVVVDNDGGGIFSFLPPGQELAPERFELLFGTPHGVDLAGLATAHGLRTAVVDRSDGIGRLREALDAALARGGVEVVVARTDRATNVAVHEEIHAAVHAALPAPA